MKKTILLTGLFGLAATFLSGCVNNASTKINTKEVFLMEAVTGLNMINPTSNVRKAIRRSANKPISEEQQQKIKECLPTVDMLLNNNQTFESVIETVNQEIDGVNYEFKETIKYLNSSLEFDSYVLYYNNYVIDEEDNDEDENEVEVTSKTSGLAFLSDDIYYSFVSKIEKEIEDDETEEERMFLINIDENSYIKIKEEYEVEGNEKEQTLKYLVVENGVTTIDYSIEIEEESNEQSIKLKVGDSKFKVVKETKDDETIYKVSYKDEDTKIVATYKKEIDENGNISFVII